MRKIDLAIIGIRLLALFLLFKHLDVFIEILAYPNLLNGKDALYDNALLLYMMVSKLVYLALLIMAIYFAPFLAKRLVADIKSDNELINFPSFDLSIFGLFIVAGYSFLDGVSDVLVEAYSYLQDKLSGVYDRVQLYNAKVLYKSLLKALLSFIVIYFHKSIYKYLESVDRK